ncbi:thermonuclease family protein [Gracilibacillus sp. HCP3S3_G5_1]|uniref:thermonuclease family protein n=1 Tax=unclassified Gracilibacillus TaxID=2625209 RepID=UPI003F8C2CC5
MLAKKWLISLLILIVILSACGTAPMEKNQNETSSSNTSVEDKISQENREPADEHETVTLENDSFSNATVSRVVDGDTLNIELNGQKETVRLLLVDTPETKHPTLPVQPFGPEATEFAIEKLAGKDIQIEFDGPKRDNYDRMLGYIWVDGENFNQLLLEEGLARYAYVYDPPYIHQDEMQQAEQQARDSGIGIWSIDGYVNENGFNHEVVENDPTGEPETPEEDIYYTNCTEAHEAGVTPLHEDDTGYGSHLDRDGDGVACE